MKCKCNKKCFNILNCNYGDQGPQGPQGETGPISYVSSFSRNYDMNFTNTIILRGGSVFNSVSSGSIVSVNATNASNIYFDKPGYYFISGSYVTQYPEDLNGSTRAYIQTFYELNTEDSFRCVSSSPTLTINTTSLYDGEYFSINFGPSIILIKDTSIPFKLDMSLSGLDDSIVENNKNFLYNFITVSAIWIAPAP